MTTAFKYPLSCFLATVHLLGFEPHDGELKPKPKVRAIASMEKYCLGQPGGALVWERQLPDTITLRFHVQLVYSNPGSRPLILPLRKDWILIVSRNREDMERSRHQRYIRLGPRIAAPDVTRGGTERPSLLDFEVIPPGGDGSMIPGENIFLAVHTRSSKQNQTDLLGKKVFLQLELDHLQFPKRLADELSKKWKDFGYLWTGKVRTEPIEINVPLSPTFADCSHEYRID